MGIHFHPWVEYRDDKRNIYRHCPVCDRWDEYVPASDLGDSYWKAAKQPEKTLIRLPRLNKEDLRS